MLILRRCPFLFYAGLFFLLKAAPTLASPKIPELTGPVVDELSLLDSNDKDHLRDLLLKVDASGKIQMAIYIAESLQGYDIESFSMAVAEKWKLGKKGQDQGLLMVVAPRERKMRFEVGYGLEGVITDAESRHILDRLVVPYFKQRRYGEGLMIAVEAVAKKLGVEADAPVENRLNVERRRAVPFTMALVQIIFLFFFLFISLISMASRRRGWRGSDFLGGGWGGGGGSWGGGGFGGGGGGFGGGGSSSSW